jgi:hypothetical protein
LTLVALFTIACAPHVAAQPWRDAYQAGDYRTAAALLHPLVMDQQLFADPRATERLASMYAEGLGVAVDAVLACALFDYAAHSERGQPGRIPHDLGSFFEQQSRRAQLEEARASHCSRLGAPQQAEAGRLLGCFTADFPSQHFELGTSRAIDVTRGGIVVRNGQEESRDNLNLDHCITEVALVRYTRADAAGPSPAARHFLEIYAWTRVWRDGRAARALVWTLREVIGSHAVFRALETLVDNGTPAWPAPPLSFALADVALIMAPSGDVTWRFGAGDTRQGVLKAPPRRRAVASLGPAVGTGSVQIRVLDSTGAPSQRATVILTGRVTRNGTTDEGGVVLFDALPEGRYDLSASASQQVMFPSHFVDIGRGPASPVQVSLKRAGKSSGALACGFLVAPPTTLRAFMETTDVKAVLHVKVQEQHAFEVSDGDGPARIMTLNEVAVLHAFKGAGPRGGAGTLNVLQIGGAIERGGTVDQFEQNHFLPLSVGDEYVLFLTRPADGAMSIHNEEDGAFRLRNGLVEPLGTSVIAAEWKNAAASEFFAELSAITAGGAH